MRKGDFLTIILIKKNKVEWPCLEKVKVVSVLTSIKVKNPLTYNIKQPSNSASMTQNGLKEIIKPQEENKLSAIDIIKNKFKDHDDLHLSN